MNNEFPFVDIILYSYCKGLMSMYPLLREINRNKRNHRI